ALDVSRAHRVSGAGHDDGDSRGCLLESGQRCPRSDNYVRLETDQLGGQAGEALGLASGPARLGHEMLAIYVAELVHSAHERVRGWAPGLGPDQVGGHRQTEDADPSDLSCRLGRGGARHREGPEGEAADEGAPVHHGMRIQPSMRRRAVLYTVTRSA